MLSGRIQDQGTPELSSWGNADSPTKAYRVYLIDARLCRKSSGQGQIWISTPKALGAGGIPGARPQGISIALPCPIAAVLSGVNFRAGRFTVRSRTGIARRSEVRRSSDPDEPAANPRRPCWPSRRQGLRASQPLSRL